MLTTENKIRRIGLALVIFLFLSTSLYVTLCTSSTKNPPPSTTTSPSTQLPPTSAPSNLKNPSP